MSAPQTPLTPLALWVRILLFLVGWLLVLVGIAGLVLPGIQGIVTILAGATVLSLASELVYKALWQVFRRWPTAWKKIVAFRRKVRGWLERLGRGQSKSPANPIDASPRHPPPADD